MPQPLFKANIATEPHLLEDAGSMPPGAAAGDGREVVLLVDDHDLVRATTAEALSELGYRVVEAGSGEEAVRMLEDGLHADLIVTDLFMPGLSGIDLAAFAHERRPGLPVLLVSGDAEPDGVPAGLPCLAKPFRRAVLAECLAGLRQPA